MTAMPLHVVLAAEPLPENVRPGWTALVIVLVMGIALALLMWSMVRQFRKVDFDEGDDEADSADQAGEDDADDQHDRDGHKANGSASS